MNRAKGTLKTEISVMGRVMTRAFMLEALVHALEEGMVASPTDSQWQLDDRGFYRLELVEDKKIEVHSTMNMSNGWYESLPLSLALNVMACNKIEWNLATRAPAESLWWTAHRKKLHRLACKELKGERLNQYLRFID